jgi:hypothetical protein
MIITDHPSRGGIRLARVQAWSPSKIPMQYELIIGMRGPRRREAIRTVVRFA